MERPSQSDLKKAFDVIDVDSSGQISVLELDNMLKNLGYQNISQERVEKYLQTYDIDGNG